MREIKFSHDYFKLMGRVSKEYHKAKLLQVLKVHYTQLSKVFINYDTVYGELQNLKNYPIPETDLILLIFITDYRQDLFTTIRRFTPLDWRYYKSSEGEWFKVVSPSTQAKS